jgi:hypothetical protein
MTAFEVDRQTTRIIVWAIVLLVGAIAVKLLFFNKKGGFNKGDLPTGGDGLKYQDNSGKTKTYDPYPLAEALNRVLNEDPSVFSLPPYDIDVTALESVLEQLNRLGTPDMKYAVIDTYANSWAAKNGSLLERLNAASYWTTDPTYRDQTLALIRSRQAFNF